MFSRLSSSPNHRTLLEFRAGKMFMIGRMVHPDTRKGLVYLVQSNDNLIHFCWKDRISGVTEEDLITFPDDFEYKRVDQCKTGRVYVLISKTTPERNFFWLQEPKTDRDEEFCNRVNEIMNGRSTTVNPAGNIINTGDLNFVLNNMTPQQLLQLFTQLGRIEQTHPTINRQPVEDSPAPTTVDDNSWPTTTASSKRSGASTATPTSLLSTSSSSSSKTNKYTSKKSTTPKNNLETLVEVQSTGNLSDVENKFPKIINFSMLLNNSEATEKILGLSNIERLAKYLPNVDGVQNSKNIKQRIKDTLNSAEFQGSLREFSTLLETGELGKYLRDFNLKSNVLKALETGKLEVFIQELEKEN